MFGQVSILQFRMCLHWMWRSFNFLRSFGKMLTKHCLVVSFNFKSYNPIIGGRTKIGDLSTRLSLSAKKPLKNEEKGRVGRDAKSKIWAKSFGYNVNKFYHTSVTWKSRIENVWVAPGRISIKFSVRFSVRFWSKTADQQDARPLLNRRVLEKLSRKLVSIKRGQFIKIISKASSDCCRVVLKFGIL